MRTERIVRFHFRSLGASRARRRVVVVGAGPVGLTLAIDLRLKGIDVTLVDEDDTVSTGSRAICWAKRSLEIFDRLGVAEPIVARGITWNTGRVFHRDRQVYEFNLQAEAGHAFPAFVNLQQYHVEEALVERAMAVGVEILWKHRLAGLDLREQPTLAIETPDGACTIEADWVLACDGAKSQVRRLMGLDFKGQVFEDRFLIADVHMEADFPTERWFWFDPPFHPGGSALLHRQADDIWRIDLQLGRDADPAEERRPERVIQRLRAMLGPDRAFELDWVSVYTFQCRRLDRFRHDRVVFLGDAAHQVSPFGARGGNSGIQDADNLAWKLALVLKGEAPERLLDSYDAERGPAADENILNSTRSTDFITPKTEASRRFRDAALSLAGDHAFARSLINSGRLSVASVYAGSPLNTADVDVFSGGPRAGSAATDAPDGKIWLLPRLGGSGFTLLRFGPGLDGPVRTVEAPADGIAAARYDACAGTAYLIRPDQHVAARWRQPSRAGIEAALARATGRTA
ncbi:MAG: FAD-dependent oxidoreductase [Alphaproteobacteria bacterium]|nr:FAD-dependent oxidoreductase [Alphaproteobacteria bacterium]